MAKYTQTSDAKKGGMFTGKSHDEGGIPAIVTDTGQPIEVEGGEAIINKEATKLHCKELSKINQSAGNGVPIPCPDEAEEIAKKFEDGGKVTLKDKKKIFDKWRKLVNMTHTELRRYYYSNEGKKSGLSKEEADEQEISSGRESAEWILKMKKTNWKNWSNEMWKWANKQISFISRMRGNKGDLYDEKGKKTRKLMSLLIWGHNPKKYKEPVFDNGGQVEKQETKNKDLEPDKDIDTFKGGGKADDNELIAVHNLFPSNIIDANKIGGLITPSIAILKPENEFNEFGSITLICNKDLIDPVNKWDVKVFSGDVYSPSVPRKMYYFSKRDAEAFGEAMVKKAYAYQRSLWTKKYRNNSFGGDVAQIVGDYSRWYRDLGKYSSEELQNLYYDDFKVIYLLDNDIKFPIPLKKDAVYLFTNSALELTPEEEKIAKEFAQKRLENDRVFPENLKDNLYDFLWQLFLDYSKNWRLKANIEIDDFENSQIADAFRSKFGTKDRFFGAEDVAYKLSQYVFPNYIIDTTAWKNSVNKIVKRQEPKYKEWLNDFMDQWQKGTYFIDGKEKRSWTLDNLVDATTGATRGQEDTMTFGLNKARSFGLKQFTSIQDIKSKADKLLNTEEVNAIQKEQKDRFLELAGKFKYAYSSEWSKMDDFGKVIADYLKGRSISSALSKNDFSDPYDYKGTLEQFILEVKNSPVDYFEAKMQRAVKLSEFKYAVVPIKQNENKKTYDEAIKILKDNGIKIFKYSTPEERTELVAEITKKKKLRFEHGGGIFNEIYSKKLALDYYDPSVRKTAKKLKEENQEAIDEASTFLANQVSSNDVLISMPSRSGCPTDTKRLAEAIAEKTGAKVFNCLIGKERESVYNLKKSGTDISKFDFDFSVKGNIPKGEKYFIVDNVIGTGTTMKSAMKVVKDNVGENVYPLVYAIDPNNLSKFDNGGLVAKIGDKVYFFDGIRNGEIYVQKAIVEEIDTDFSGNKIYGIVYGNGTRQFIQDKLVFSTEDKAKEYGIKQKNKWLDYTNNKFETGGLFHGSPYKFDKFSNASINTGEGSQAYGWGLYFTSLKDVAQWYAQKLGNVQIKTLQIGDFLIYKDDIVVGYDTAKNETQGKIAEYFAIYESELKYAVLNSQSEEEAENRIRLEIERTLDDFIEEEQGELENDPEYYSNSIKIAEALKNKPVKIEFESNKYIYDVTYNKGNKKPDVWLRWDKPLLEQDIKVQKALSKQFSLASFNEDFATAGDFYQSRVRKYQSDEKASKELLSLGIDGIKFPSESKVEADARGFNYVVFDDSKLSIQNISRFDDGGVVNPDQIVYVAGGKNEDAKTFYQRTYADGQTEMFTVEDYEKNILPTLPKFETSKVDKDIFEAGRLQVRNVGGELTYYKKVNKRWEFLDKDELEELEKGRKHEMEHSQTMRSFMRNDIPKEVIASSIAWEHIQETPDYYDKLEKAIPEEMAKGSVVKDKLNLLTDNIGIDRSKIPLHEESKQIYVGQFKASNKDILEVYVSEVNLSDYHTDWEGRRYLKEEFVRKIVAKNEKAQVTLSFSEKYNKIKIYYLDSSSSKYFHELSKRQKPKGKEIKKYLDLGVQNLSYGTDLLKLLIKQADAKGIEKIVAHDTSAFGSQKFWEKMDFVPDEYREHDYVLILNPEENAKGNLIKRADGSYSQRGLWDNIRANIGSGRKPTKEMLEQEEKIKSRQKDMFDDGGKTENKMEIETPKGVINNYLDTPVTYRNVKAVRPETFIVSPYDKKFMAICNKFAGSDGLRPVMTGVSFEKNQATVTDAHKLLHVATTKSDFEGIYPTDNTIKYADKNIDFKNEKFPNWRAIIPEDVTSFQVDTMKLYQYIKVAVNYANKTTNAIILKYENNKLGVNGKFLLTCLEALMKIQKCPKIYFHISSPSRAITISYVKNISKDNDTWALVMPVMIDYLVKEIGIFAGEYGAFDVDMGIGLSAYFDLSTNQIYNSDNTIAKYQETYDQGNEMPSGLIAMFNKMIDKKASIPICETLCVSGGEIRSFNFGKKYNESFSVETTNDYNLPNGCYSIVNNGLQFNVGYSVEDFPKHKDRPATNGAKLSMSVNAFKYYFEQTTKHTGDDELRVVLMSVLIQKRGNTIKFVGTDANTLCVFNVSKYASTNQENDFDLLISNADAINNFMRSVDVSNINIYWNDKYFRIDAGRLQFQSSFIDGKYPNYEAVIPREYLKTLEFNIKDIMTCIKSEEMKQFATTEGEKIKDCSILNVGNKIYAVRSSAQNRKNEELEEAEQICSVNINTTNDQGSISLNDSLVLLMPMGYSIENERKIKPTNFYFNIDKLTRAMETLGTDTFKAHYTELNRAYVLTSKQMDFDKADFPKEVKQKEVKPKVVYQAKPQPKVVYQAEVKKSEVKKPILPKAIFNLGEKFELPNGEIIEIKRLFEVTNHSEKDWVEYLRQGKSMESSAKSLKLFLRRWKAEPTSKTYSKPVETKTKEEKSSQLNVKDIKDALAGAEAYLKYATGTEVSDIIVYIRGLKILLK